MSDAQWQLAQVNIGRARGAPTDPIMQEFVAQLAEINGLADQSPGFLWRLQTEDGNATAHAAVMRRRREWFERFEGIYLALWWVPTGHRPSVEEAVSRLAHLEAHGPTHYAFSFAQPFDSEGHPLVREGATRDDVCPAG